MIRSYIEDAFGGVTFGGVTFEAPTFGGNYPEGGGESGYFILDSSLLDGADVLG